MSQFNPSYLSFQFILIYSLIPSPLQHFGSVIFRPYLTIAIRHVDQGKLSVVDALGLFEVASPPLEGHLSVPRLHIVVRAILHGVVVVGQEHVQTQSRISPEHVLPDFLRHFLGTSQLGLQTFINNIRYI